jgi:Fic family protein
MAHLNLVMIHPYADGNGRLGRCLQTMVLARTLATANPVFVSIEEYLGSNTPAYYRVLAETGAGLWNPARDTRAWLRFNLTAHYRQARTIQLRAQQLQRIWDLLEAEAGRRGLPERAVLALADAVTGLKVRNATYRRAAEISVGAANRDLRELARAGLLIPMGETRGRVYQASPGLKALVEGVAAPAKVEDPFGPPA